MIFDDKGYFAYFSLRTYVIWCSLELPRQGELTKIIFQLSSLVIVYSCVYEW